MWLNPASSFTLGPYLHLLLLLFQACWLSCSLNVPSSLLGKLLSCSFKPAGLFPPKDAWLGLLLSLRPPQRSLQRSFLPWQPNIKATPPTSAPLLPTFAWLLSVIHCHLRYCKLYCWSLPTHFTYQVLWGQGLYTDCSLLNPSAHCLGSVNIGSMNGHRISVVCQSEETK